MQHMYINLIVVVLYIRVVVFFAWKTNNITASKHTYHKREIQNAFYLIYINFVMFTFCQRNFLRITLYMNLIPFKQVKDVFCFQVKIYNTPTYNILCSTNIFTYGS